jgi:hypothetical protein
VLAGKPGAENTGNAILAWLTRPEAFAAGPPVHFHTDGKHKKADTHLAQRRKASSDEAAKTTETQASHPKAMVQQTRPSFPDHSRLPPAVKIQPTHTKL